MDVPLIDQVLHVSQHFGLNFYSRFNGTYILRPQYIVDSEQIIINFSYQIIIIA